MSKSTAGDTRSAAHDADLERYSRQVLCAQIGPQNQRRLLAARAVVVGCGALGSAVANLLVRAGLGFLRVVDRDYIELNNLQRQSLFDEQDIADNLPKAEAAARRLARINSSARVEPAVADVNPDNVETLIGDAQLVLDGTDNLETRFLINDACVKHRRPWIYGACIGTTGMVMPILPGDTPCLRCIWPEPPPPGAADTCDTAGILGPVVDIVASWQAIEALKVLTGQLDAVQRRLLQFDAWAGRVDWFDLREARQTGDCPCCGRGEFPFLAGPDGSRSVTLCGRDAVQVCPAPGGRVDLSAVAEKVRAVAAAPPTHNRFLLRFTVEDCEVTLFADGRAIIKGVTTAEAARGVYARYIGA